MEVFNCSFLILEIVGELMTGEYAEDLVPEGKDSVTVIPPQDWAINAQAIISDYKLLKKKWELVTHHLGTLIHTCQAHSFGGHPTSSPTIHPPLTPIHTWQEHRQVSEEWGWVTEDTVWAMEAMEVMEALEGTEDMEASAIID